MYFQRNFYFIFHTTFLLLLYSKHLIICSTMNVKTDKRTIVVSSLAHCVVLCYMKYHTKANHGDVRTIQLEQIRCHGMGCWCYTKTVHSFIKSNPLKTSLQRRLEAQTLSDATSQTSKIHLSSKIAVTFEPMKQF